MCFQLKNEILLRHETKLNCRKFLINTTQYQVEQPRTSLWMENMKFRQIRKKKNYAHLCISYICMVTLRYLMFSERN